MKLKVISIDKSFKHWEVEELQNYFGLLEQEDFVPLQQWLVIEVSISKQEKDFLQELQVEAKHDIRFWNEMELRQNFIIPLTNFVKFKNKERQINFFAERTFTASIENKIVKATLHGVVDWLVATGRQKPKQPLFFIHEYKKEKGVDNDPLGQLLTTMVAAQKLNQKPPQPTIFNPIPKHFYKDIPIYGAYVSGRYWFFVALKGKEYSISSSFDCTKETDLQAIFKILKAQKQLIYSYLEK